ncbi:MAG: hypothetical protein HGA45_06885 [Chloroflexales bacterium]|nr:hypothetical protein [Chloroflexales bacterium]
MITIIADRHRYASAPAGALVATGPVDYVLVRRRIRGALDQGEPLIVYATDPVVLGWLADLHRYPESRVTWRVVDPGEEFTQRFGVMPAEPFTSKRIAALRLDELPRPPGGALVHPLTWILGQRLDPLWQHDEPPPGHAALLAAWAIHRTEPLDADLAALAQAQLERWSMHKPLYQALRAASLPDDSAKLLLRWALQRYDSGWRRAQPWGGLPTLEGEPTPGAVAAVLRGQHNAIQDYWGRQIAGALIDADFIAAALAQMTGLSETELSALQTMLQRCPEALDSRLLQAIGSRFAHLSAAEATLRSFAETVAPPKPPLPDPSWPVERWLGWATQQYMPYYAWVIRGSHGRDHQQECALRYSDWLYTQYPSWLNDDRSPLLLSQYQDMCALIEHDERAVVVWLIIDGMTWWQGALMREACEQHGLHPRGQRPGVAVLPSITSISKRGLVTGQPTIDLSQTTIADAARLKLGHNGIPAVVGYDLAAAIKALRKQPGLRVAVALFNLIDDLAHQSATFTDNAGIRGQLEDLARELSNAQQVCAEQGRRLHVLIGSDHGSTLLPTDAPSVPLPNTVREIDDVWESEIPGQEAPKPGTRAAATDLDRIPVIDQHVWYALDRDRFQLDRHYLVPRGYSYIKRRPSGWTHGGLTPEETIIPLLHLSPEQTRVRPIELELRGTLRAGQAGTVSAVLRNLNPFQIEDLTLIVSGSPDQAMIAHIGALEQHEVELHFAAVMAQGAELPVTYEVRYTAFGSPQRDTGRAQIPLRRLQTEDTSFDDMFN